MSRYSKIPINVVDGVDIQIDGDAVKVKGPKGELFFSIPSSIKVFKEENLVRVNLKMENDIKNKSFVGLTFKVINNMMVGVTEGFEKILEFSGVGYRMAVKGNVLNMQLGFSHDVNYEIPEGIVVEVKQSTVTVLGIDKELVGRVADKIKSFRPIEPYKGKGIKYSGQYVLRKAGKAGN